MCDLKELLSSWKLDNILPHLMGKFLLFFCVFAFLGCFVVNLCTYDIL